MATFTTQPPHIAFAANPLIIGVAPSLAGYTLHRIVLELTATGMDTPAVSKSFKLSLPVADPATSLTFDIHLLVGAMLEQYTTNRSPQMGALSAYAPYVRYSYKAYDQYTDEYGALINAAETEESAYHYAIPGGMSAHERLTAPADTATYIRNFRLLSSKPSGETIPTGGTLILPFVSPSAQTISVEDSDNTLATVTTEPCRPEWTTVTPSAGQQFVKVVPQTGVAVTKYFRTTKNPFALQFEFVNRWGTVENIYTYGRKETSATLESERQELRQKPTFRPTTKYVRHILNADNKIATSTGPLTKEWAQWFADEFFTATQVWMHDPTDHTVRPVIVEPDESIITATERTATLADIPFTITLLC